MVSTLKDLCLNMQNKLSFVFGRLFFFIFILSFNISLADTNFNSLQNKKVSYLDFFLLKYESTLMRKAGTLSAQVFPTRVQYSNIGVRVKYFHKKKEIHTELYAIMDKNRYSKIKYNQKTTDCNQVRNLMFYGRTGYSFFRQKRNPELSTDAMNRIFIENFFEGMSFSKEEIDFLISKMFLKITIFHPINKTELVCSGKVNDYELN